MVTFLILAAVAVAVILLYRIDGLFEKRDPSDGRESGWSLFVADYFSGCLFRILGAALAAGIFAVIYIWIS